ncbi:MAG: hypothetical protein P4K94_10585 [Terracidiphilus sp.]|jgi:hypothetical protein|nr:hypothetical protein [Terracidiphilus sp.]
MTAHILSKVPILGKFVDERFLEHRRRSTSLAGIAACLVAIALFEYRFFVNHFWSWDLLAVAITMVVVKMAMMAWYRFHD